MFLEQEMFLGGLSMKNKEKITNIAENVFPDDIARIVVIGIGGGGGNAVNYMYEHGIQGVEFYITNTDKQVLSISPIEETHRIELGPKLTNGLGAGGDPSVGQQAAIESKEELRNIVRGADLVFLSAGMGGGSGTGAIPQIAKIAKEEGALTVACVTEPFSFEGRKRRNVAQDGIDELVKSVDSLIIISNDNLISLVGRKPIKEAFATCDEVLNTCVKSVSELITVPALINLDFADVKSVLFERGRAFFGMGIANGKEDVAIKAAHNAISSPLLKHRLEGAKSAIVSITGGMNMTLFDSEDVVRTIEEATKAQLEIIYGVNIDPEFGDTIMVTLIATGYDDEEGPEPLPQKIEKIERVERVEKVVEAPRREEKPSDLRFDIPSKQIFPPVGDQNVGRNFFDEPSSSARSANRTRKEENEKPSFFKNLF